MFLTPEQTDLLISLLLNFKESQATYFSSNGTKITYVQVMKIYNQIQNLIKLGKEQYENS